MEKKKNENFPPLNSLYNVHLFPKLNRTQVFSQQKYHVGCVGGMLGWRCDHMEDCMSVQKIIEKSRKAERFYRKTAPSSLCVCISVISDLLLHFG